MNLYQTSQLATLEAHTDQETGEIDFESWELAQTNLEEKRCAVIAYIRNSSARAALLSAESKALAERAKAESVKTDRLIAYLQGNMKDSGITEFRSGVFEVKVYLDRDTSVQIDQDAVIPKEFLRPPADPLPDKAKLKKAIELGAVIPGVSIVKKDRMVIK